MISAMSDDPKQPHDFSSAESPTPPPEGPPEAPRASDSPPHGALPEPDAGAPSNPDDVPEWLTRIRARRGGGTSPDPGRWSACTFRFRARLLLRPACAEGCRAREAAYREQAADGPAALHPAARARQAVPQCAAARIRAGAAGPDPTSPPGEERPTAASPA